MTVLKADSAFRREATPVHGELDLADLALAFKQIYISKTDKRENV